MDSFDLFHNYTEEVDRTQQLHVVVPARSQPSRVDEVAKQRCLDLSKDFAGLDHGLYVSELGYSLPIIHAL
jgi:hypothetical protein